MGRKLRQAEVRWANLPLPAGRRPVLVLTRTEALRHLTSVTVAPITRTIRDTDAEVLLGERDGVPTACAASLENILTVPQARLDDLIATLGAERMDEVFAAVRFVFSMTGSPSR